ncbi:MAG: hypothetical protein R6V06_03620 [Kiritimatiellia bacterium]
MNLTLKQLFKFGAVCACASALSATAATNYVEDSFEVSDGGSEGLAISQYKFTTEGGLDEVTNYAWFAEAGDASMIILTNEAYASYTGDGPIIGTSELMLDLATEGNTLSRTCGVTVADNSYLYVDTMIQFTPSEDDPLIDDDDLKVALFVNAQSNLVVRHGRYDDPGEPNWDYTLTLTNSVIDGLTIDPDQWYRLSIAVYYDEEINGEVFCRIALDGTVISHGNAYDYDGDVNGGTYFHSCVNDYDNVLEKVSFQGTGSVDEFVLTDTDYAEVFGGGTAVMITLVSEGGNVTFNPEGPVESGTSVEITATDDWMWLASLNGAVSEAGVVDAVSITTNLTAAGSESCTVTAVVEYADSSQPIGDGSYPYDSVGPWASANGLTPGSDFTGLEDDYLLNVAPDTNAELTIDSITVDGTDVTIVVGNTDNANVDLDNINGTLTLYSTTTLDGTWTEVGSAAVGSGNDTVQIDISGVANATDFFKAVVE